MDFKTGKASSSYAGAIKTSKNNFCISSAVDLSTLAFVIKTPPAAAQLLEAAKVKKGSSEPNRSKVASVTWDQVRKIAEDKMQDLNAFTVDSAMKMVAGTARSMGLNVKGQSPF